MSIVVSREPRAQVARHDTGHGQNCRFRSLLDVFRPRILKTFSEINQVCCSIKKAQLLARWNEMHGRTIRVQGHHFYIHYILGDSRSMFMLKKTKYLIVLADVTLWQSLWSVQDLLPLIMAPWETLVSVSWMFDSPFPNTASTIFSVLSYKVGG